MSLLSTPKFNVSLPAAPSTTDPDLHRELLIVYNSIRLLSDAISRIYRIPVIFYETMVYGDMVSFLTDAGIQKVRKAQHATYEAHGFVTTAATAGNVGEVQLHGIAEVVGGNPAGTKYWLSTTAGAVIAASPGAGAQRVGYAISPTQVWIDPVFVV